MRRYGRQKRSAITDRIYLNLKERIYSGELAPYEILSLTNLAKTFKASLTPVSAALAKLSEEGIVIKQPNKSCIVAGMSAEGFRKDSLAGALFEGMAAFMGTFNITAKEIRNMESTVKEMKAANKSGDILQLRDLNREFHSTYILCCKNEELLELIKEYSWKLYHYYFIVFSLPVAVSDIILQHIKIIENLKTGDPKSVREAVEEHVMSAREMVLKYTPWVFQ